MIVCSPKKLLIGSIISEFIGDRNAQPIRMNFYVKRRATRDEWVQCAVEHKAVDIIPIYNRFYEIVAD